MALTTGLKEGLSSDVRRISICFFMVSYFTDSGSGSCEDRIYERRLSRTSLQAVTLTRRGASLDNVCISSSTFGSFFKSSF